MDSITLKNFRCFREEQTVRLAPLTLLVGENSTGKTSFMAMIRALWDAAQHQRTPDFKEAPYDLGSFDEIVHYQGGRADRATTFMAAFTFTRGAARRNGGTRDDATRDIRRHYRFEFEFEESDTAPALGRSRFYGGSSPSKWDCWIELNFRNDPEYLMALGTPNGSWVVNARPGKERFFRDRFGLLSLPYEFFRASQDVPDESVLDIVPVKCSAKLREDDWAQIPDLPQTGTFGFFPFPVPPYAGAPVRSKPRRTYDPRRLGLDPEGDYIPMFLASAQYRDERQWKRLKELLEGFGRAAGLFDELSIRRLGKSIGDPFQLQVRRYAGKRKGPLRNLIDVGYGVSQVLPVITELLRSDEPGLFLLQQPEVHLHPSAQAALGSLFGQLAGTDRQIIVETHSDYLLDRVRMDVRDKKTPLKPADVSILYFERGDLEVRIHEISFDEHGNVRNAPPTYRRFFAEETRRALRL